MAYPAAQVIPGDDGEGQGRSILEDPLADGPPQHPQQGGRGPKSTQFREDLGMCFARRVPDSTREGFFAVKTVHKP